MSAWRTVFDYVLKPLSVVPVVLVVQDNVGHISKTVGRSMQPTLNPELPDGTHRSDRVLVEKISIAQHKFRRGDVVSLRAPENPRVKYVKRIVGLPGDVVRTRSWQEPLVKIPPGHCWIEGDNHECSKDSNVYGPVPLGLIEARVTHVVWPPHRIGRVRNYVALDRIEQLASH